MVGARLTQQYRPKLAAVLERLVARLVGTVCVERLGAVEHESAARLGKRAHTDDHRVGVEVDEASEEGEGKGGDDGPPQAGAGRDARRGGEEGARPREGEGVKRGAEMNFVTTVLVLS